MSWISPTGYNDPSSKWSDETNAYDQNLNTTAYCVKTEYYLELTHNVLNCDKVRIYCYDWKSGMYDPDIDIDVYYSGAWHNIWSGVVNAIAWVEKQIGSTQAVTAARVKINSLGGGHAFHICEFEFNEVIALINGYYMQDGTKEEKFGYFMNSIEEFGYYMNSL